MSNAAAYGPGNVNDPGVWYAWESSPSYLGAISGPSSFDWGGVTSGLFGLADTYLKADTAVKMQQASDGRRYVEGQALQPRPSSALSIPTELLIIGGLVALAMFAKS